MTRGDPIHVLHIDDDKDYLELTRINLEKADENMTVDTVANSKEGLSKLEENGYDAVVIDYKMPELNGLDFLKRARESHERLPIVFLTGKGSEEIASEAISAGVTEYMQKEPGKNQFIVLANRVRTLVENKRAEEKLQEESKKVLQTYERIREAVIATDGEWQITYANDEAESILGAGLEGNLLWSVIGDHAQAEFEEPLRSALNQAEPTNFEAHLEDPTRFLTVWAYSGDNGLTIFLNDVTEEHERQEELEEMREELEITEEKFETLRSRFSRPGAPFR